VNAEAEDFNHTAVDRGVSTEVTLNACVGQWAQNRMLTYFIAVIFGSPVNAELRTSDTIQYLYVRLRGGNGRPV
jgi:hypothetical protein